MRHAVAVERAAAWRPSTGDVITIGLDIAKQAFHAHGVDQRGEVVFRRRLRRNEVTAFFAGPPACLIGMEACASAHHWARALMAQGHDVRLMPPGYVKPSAKRQKNDAADAEAVQTDTSTVAKAVGRRGRGRKAA